VAAVPESDQRQSETTTCARKGLPVQAAVIVSATARWRLFPNSLRRSHYRPEAGKARRASCGESPCSFHRHDGDCSRTAFGAHITGQRWERPGEPRAANHRAVSTGAMAVSGTAFGAHITGHWWKGQASLVRRLLRAASTSAMATVPGTAFGAHITGHCFERGSEPRFATGYLPVKASRDSPWSWQGAVAIAREPRNRRHPRPFGPAREHGSRRRAIA